MPIFYRSEHQNTVVKESIVLDAIENRHLDNFNSYAKNTGKMLKNNNKNSTSVHFVLNIK